MEYDFAPGHPGFRLPCLRLRPQQDPSSVRSGSRLPARCRQGLSRSFSVHVKNPPLEWRHWHLGEGCPECLPDDIAGQRLHWPHRPLVSNLTPEDARNLARLAAMLVRGVMAATVVPGVTLRLIHPYSTARHWPAHFIHIRAPGCFSKRPALEGS